DVLHRIEVAAVLDARFEQTDDVGMVKLAEDIDLSLEPGEQAGVEGQVGGQDLDRGTLRKAVPRDGAASKVDTAHAAATDLSLEDPRTQPCDDHVVGIPAQENARGRRET